MSWTRMKPGEPETIYTSNATTLSDLTSDIKFVVDRMIENRATDEATDAEQLLFYINATNGYIRILWTSDTDILGRWVYHLELPTLHEGGDAFVYDKLCYDAIWDYTEENNFDEHYNTIYRIFYRTELTDVEEIDI